MKRFFMVQAVDTYAGAGKWAAAHKVAMGYLSKQEVNVCPTVCTMLHIMVTVTRMMYDAV